MGSGFGPLDRAVAFETRGPRFETSQRQLQSTLYLLLTVGRRHRQRVDNCRETEARNGAVKKVPTHFRRRLVFIPPAFGKRDSQLSQKKIVSALTQSPTSSFVRSFVRSLAASKRKTFNSSQTILLLSHFCSQRRRRRNMSVNSEY